MKLLVIGFFLICLAYDGLGQKGLVIDYKKKVLQHKPMKFSFHTSSDIQKITIHINGKSLGRTNQVIRGVAEIVYTFHYPGNKNLLVSALNAEENVVYKEEITVFVEEAKLENRHDDRDDDEPSSVMVVTRPTPQPKPESTWGDDNWKTPNPTLQREPRKVSPVQEVDASVPVKTPANSSWSDVISPNLSEETKNENSQKKESIRWEESTNNTKEIAEKEENDWKNIKAKTQETINTQTSDFASLADSKFPPTPLENEQEGKNDNAYLPLVKVLTKVDKQVFISDISPLASSFCKKNDLPASAVIAIAVLESSYGTTRTAFFANNLFGIKTNSYEAKDSYQLVGQPDEDGGKTKVIRQTEAGEKIFDEATRKDNRYIKFASRAECLKYFVSEILAKKRLFSSDFRGAIKNYKTNLKKGMRKREASRNFIYEIADQGFSDRGGLKYLGLVAPILDEWELYELD